MDNHILCEYTIKEENLKSPVQIINYFDNEKKYLYGKENQKEIKELCELYLNGNKIDFTFKYKFDKEGKYRIKVVCKKPLTNTSHMFYDCSCLTFLDLSHFNSSNLTNTNGMFHNCTSLTTILLMNFNSNNVKTMTNMFRDCTSLTSLDLSNFNKIYNKKNEY